MDAPPEDRVAVAGHHYWMFLVWWCVCVCVCVCVLGGGRAAAFLYLFVPFGETMGSSQEP